MNIKKTLTTAAAVLSIAGLFAFTLSQNMWNIKSDEAKIHFDMPNGKHNGNITGLDASFDFDPMHPEKAAIKATVELKNLKTDNEKLDAHLMTADFFDAEKHPTITFTADQVTKNDTGFVATGKLAMRDSVHTVSVPFTFTQDGKKGLIKGSMDIFAGDYGVGKKSSGGNDRVLISIEIPVSKE